MGIDGLLRLLKPITQKQHISTFKGQRVGVDIMPWIYHGCYSCSYELNQNIQSIKFLYYLLEMMQMLSYYNIKPIFVFDGRRLQMKSETNEKRRKNKQENKAKGLQFLKEGNHYQARKYLSRSIFIDQRILSLTINVLITKNLQFIVAPYQADCQIAKLYKLNLIDVAISEDSDLLAYGVKTILKLNQNGDCDYVDVDKWKPRHVDSSFLKQYLAMNYVNKLQAVVLAGTDYNASVKGIGIKRAVRYLYREGTTKNLLDKLKSEKVYQDKVPQDYQQLVNKVKLIFMFATVYNPIIQQLQPLSPQLLDNHKPQLMTLQELDRIVGIKYDEYLDKNIFSGRTQPTKLIQREIKMVNIRQIFQVNRQALLIREAHNESRREDYEKLRQQKQKNEDIVPVRKEKKETKPKKQLTFQQKEQRKEQRKKRVVKLQDMMSSVMCMFDDDVKEESYSSSSEKQIEKQPQQSEISESSSSSSSSVSLGFLNPFAKTQKK